MATRKVIVTVAPTGGFAMKAHNPHLPTQPEEIAEDVVRCFNAGASVAALHARNADDSATCNPEIYRRINQLIRGRCDIVLNNSGGGGLNGDMARPVSDGLWEVALEERMKAADGGAEMVTLNAMTVLATLGGRDTLLTASPTRSREFAQRLRDRGIKPEWEAFSPAHLLQDMRTLIDEGLDEPPYFVNLCLGLHHVFQGAVPYSPKMLQVMVEFLPSQSLFTVSAAGDAQLPATVQMLLLGGHVRVGLEDNLHYRPGEPATNVQLVERIVRIIRELGMEPATPAEAREMLGLPRRRPEA
ncbi:3-keto-5-aminohexanoate cleavage protein [Inquilinus limosus]|uniref:3-keto-5-aminohexanoate cleavage protein n=1 Tax=Inquilinus limosus TaxID=171674 RepID=UPI003F1440D2